VFTPDVVTGALSSMEIQPGGPTDEHLTVTYTRNQAPFGLLTQVKRSAAGYPDRVDTIGYDSHFVHATKYTNALGHVTSAAVDPALGVVLSTADPNNVQTSYDYDTFGRVRRANPPGGGGATITHARDTIDPSLIMTTVVADGGGESRTFVNRLGQEVRQEDKNFDGTFTFSRRTYDSLGRPQTVTSPRKVGTPAGALTTSAYDSLGRMSSVVREEEAVNSQGSPITSATVTSRYAGLVNTITNEMQHQTVYASDELGRVINSKVQNDDLKWVPTEYTYGSFGLLSFVKRRDGAGAPVNGRVTELQYDGLGRRTVLIDPDTGKRLTSYNAFGDVREETDAAMAKTTYTTDALGRVTNKVDKDGTTSFIWDTNGIGKLAETVSPSSVKRKFLYDTGGRMCREVWTIDGSNFQIDYSYDAVSGRPQKVTYPPVPGFSERLAVTNSYDPNSGRLSKVQKEGASSAYWTLSATEVDGGLKKETFGNGVSTSYTRSLVSGRLMGISSTTSPVRSWGYAYLPDGNLQRRSNLTSSQHERFEYDRMDRIKRWADADDHGVALPGTTGWAVNYVIDDFGNMTRRQFVAGTSTGGTSQTADYALDLASLRVTSVSLWSGSYGYDANGNQTSRPDGETVTYTAFDLPKKITGPRPADFQYDAYGTRAKKLKTSTNYTLYVGGLYEKRVNGSAKDHVFYVMGPTGVVAQVTRPENGTEKTAYLHSDRLGSVDTVTDSTGVAPIEQTKRDPYGIVVSNFNQPKLPTTITASTNKVRLGFTGHEQDDELGMINMRGRMFDPRLGRFLTPDPLNSRPLNGLSFNRYAYVTNNPLRLIDPTGLGETIPGIKDPDREVPAQNFTSRDCQPQFDGAGNFTSYTCVVGDPVPQNSLPDESGGTDGGGSMTAGGSGGSGGGGAGGGAGGPGGSGTPPSNPPAPPPPPRKLAQDCTKPQCQGGNPQTVIGIVPGPKADGSDVQIVSDLLDRASALDYRNGAGAEPLFQTQLRRVMESGKRISIYVSHTYDTSTTISRGPAQNSAIGASEIAIYYNPYQDVDLSGGARTDATATLLHEIAGHGYPLLYGINLTHGQHEQAATATENSYRAAVGLPQRTEYNDSWSVPAQCLPVTQW
jgi:RHS repeat-associated protein